MTKILLVEDDKSLREIYGVRLLAEGYDIVSAGDGEDALAMAIKERPQLIVSDVMMPKISGFDMLDILRSTTETKDIRVIMMTALSSEDQRARGEALGADRYLVKSQVGIEDVVRTVHDVLGDAPLAIPSAAQTFGGPAASSPSAPRPYQTVPPARISQPYPPEPVAPIVPAPVQYTQTPPPVVSAPPLPQAIPQQQVAPPLQQPSAGLPQPTAPFSTNRPANLGDRIIHPLQSNEAKQDIGSLMAQELTGASQQTAVPQAAAAPIQPPTAPPPPTSSEPAISFEETPRQYPPAPFTPGAQPPANQ
jgi:CheY-like chemotaxis protein